MALSSLASAGRWQSEQHPAKGHALAQCDCRVEHGSSVPETSELALKVRGRAVHAHRTGSIGVNKSVPAVQSFHLQERCRDLEFGIYFSRYGNGVHFFH